MANECVHNIALDTDLPPQEVDKRAACTRTGSVFSLTVTEAVKLTQAQYNALPTKLDTVLYLITDA